jgi:DNA-binding transcriptional regulator YiaG
MISEWISGEALRAANGLLPFELVRKIQDGLQPYNAHTGEMIFVETLVNARRLELCNINQFQEFEKEYLSRLEVISERNRFISTPPPPVLESAGPIRQHSTPYVYTGDEWRRQRTNQFDRNMRSRVSRLYDEFINDLLASEFPAGWILDKDVPSYVDRFIFRVDDVAGIGLVTEDLLVSKKTVQHHVSEAHVDEPTNNKNSGSAKKRKYIRGEVSQKDAANMCGVSVRLIQNWLAGKNEPEGFPGLYDAIRLRQWAESYKLNKINKAIAVKMNNSISVDPKIIESSHSGSAFLDTPDERDTRGLEDLIVEQEREMAQERKRSSKRR